MSSFVSKWHRELELFATVKPLIIFEGNVLDRCRFPYQGSVPEGALVSLGKYLHAYLKDMGYEHVITYSNQVGFITPYQPEEIESFAAAHGLTCEQGAVASEFKGASQEGAPAVINRVLAQKEHATAIVLEMAGHYLTSPDRMDQKDVNAFALLQHAVLSAQSVKTRRGRLQNVLIITTAKVNDLPAWFYLGNPVGKTITIDPPTREERKQLLEGNGFATFFDATVYRTTAPYYATHADELERLKDKFVALTEGLTFTELDEMRNLCKRECEDVKELCAIVDLYKYGIKENPWTKLSVDSLKNAKEDFEKRIKGQDAALERTLDVVKRAVTGMNALTSSSTAKPKGILFYAGPTGTGKTESAKALAEKLFGDESACIRFDMSEYGQAHSDQKLMGAPPGYVGYEAGGQLTNAVKKNPFAILLFDEIEKAHSSILDKFLQILEDGRMTDGQGNTVYFSETIIIFTSNLGIYVKDEFGHRQPNVDMSMDYREVEDKVKSAISDYFKLELGRPEILNRIGENIVVFDYIREEAGEAILKSQVNKIIRRMDEQKRVKLVITDEAYAQLKAAALKDLSNGGRGIGNQVESLLVNPLSRAVFDMNVTDGTALTITAFDTQARPAAITCVKEETPDA